MTEVASAVDKARGEVNVGAGRRDLDAATMSLHALLDELLRERECTESANVQKWVSCDDILRCRIVWSTM